MPGSDAISTRMNRDPASSARLAVKHDHPQILNPRILCFVSILLWDHRPYRPATSAITTQRTTPVANESNGVKPPDGILFPNSTGL